MSNLKSFIKEIVKSILLEEEGKIKALENEVEEAAMQKIANKHNYQGEFRDFALELMRKSLKSNDPNLHVLAQKDYVLIGPHSVLYGDEQGANKIMVAGFTPEKGKKILQTMELSESVLYSSPKS